MIKTGDISFKGHFSLFIAYVIFGLSAPIGKSAMADGIIDPLSLTYFRMTGAAVLFWGASLFVPRDPVTRKDLFLFLGASLFGVVFNQMTFICGLSKSSPVDVSLIATLGPIITMLVAAAYLKEPITFKKVLGVLVGASGVLIIIFTGVQIQNGESHTIGNLLCIASSLSFAIYLAVFRDLVRRYKSITIMKWMFLYAAIICTPVCYRSVSIIPYHTLSAATCWNVAFVVCCATFIAYMLLPVGQKTLRPTIVSMYNYLQPIVSSILAVAIGLDTFGWSKGIAAVLVFLGVYIVTQSKSRAQIEAERKSNKS